MGRVVAAVQRLAANLEKLFILPAVAANERHGNAEFARLPDNERGFGVVTGDKYSIDAGRFYGRELRPEILVALGKVFLDHDLAATGGERFPEEFRETDAVGVGYAGEDGDPPRLQIFLGEFGHYRALKRIDEADAEDVIA